MVCSRNHNKAWKSRLKDSSVPGSSQKMLDKTRGLTADCVAYDLEDSVTSNRKAEARSNIRRFLEQPRADGIKECAVRINAVGTGHEANDIEAVVWQFSRLSALQQLTDLSVMRQISIHS